MPDLYFSKLSKSRRESMRNCSRLKKTQEKRQLNAAPAPGLDHGPEAYRESTSLGQSMKSELDWGLDNSIVLFTGFPAFP